MVASIRWRNALSLFVDFGNESQNISSMYVVLGNLELQWEPSRNSLLQGVVRPRFISLGHNQCLCSKPMVRESWNSPQF